MKSIFYKYFLFISALSLMGLVSCKKDKKQTLDLADANTTLTASSNNLQLAATNSLNVAVDFNWGAVSYGFSTSAQYALQFDNSTAFSSPVAKTIGADLFEKSYTVGDMNAIATTLHLTAGTSGKIYVRTKVTVTQYSGSVSSIDPVYSNVVELDVTKY